VRKPGCWCQGRSSAASPVRHFADFFPGSTNGIRLKPVAFEGCLSKLKRPFSFSVFNGPAQAFFNQGSNGGLLLAGDLASLLQERVRYMYGCLHTVICIPIYCSLSTEILPVEQAGLDRCQGTRTFAKLREVSFLLRSRISRPPGREDTGSSPA